MRGECVLSLGIGWGKDGDRCNWTFSRFIGKVGEQAMVFAVFVFVPKHNKL